MHVKPGCCWLLADCCDRRPVASASPEEPSVVVPDSETRWSLTAALQTAAGDGHHLGVHAQM